MSEDQSKSRQERYARLAELLDQWIKENSPYDEIVATELRTATDLTMRCREIDDDFFCS